MDHPFERALGIATRWVLIGAGLSILGLAVPQPGSEGPRLLLVSAHLVALTAFSIALTTRLSPLFDRPVFLGLSPAARRLGTDAALVALVTGAVALVTLASSAALRLQPSLQFLQLLSALDIAWSTSALQTGVRRLRSPSAGLAAGVLLGVACVASLVNYLRVIGFGPDAGWIVDAPRMAALVLPVDLVAAVLAIGSLVAASRRQPTVQRSPQS